MKRIIGVLEGRDGAEKVEVLLNRGQGRKGALSLRLLSWGEGIGWYPQKTIRLDSRQLRALQTLLKKVDLLPQPRKRGEGKRRGKVLPFPLGRSGSSRISDRISEGAKPFRGAATPPASI